MCLVTVPLLALPVAGRGIFANENNGYLLYLSVDGVLLDGIAIKGTGITPDKEIGFPLNRTDAGDPELRAALEHFSR